MNLNNIDISKLPSDVRKPKPLDVNCSSSRLIKLSSSNGSFPGIEVPVGDKQIII